MDHVHLWLAAGHAEREMLAPAYARLFAVDQGVPRYVRCALSLEILKDFDHRSWPEDFLLSGAIWDYQELVTQHSEEFALDRVQRSNYMRLAMAGKDRQNDVAYGLSGKLLWGDKTNVVEQLMNMGKRKYNASIPVAHEKENNVLHVAVSYRHTSTFHEGGTISERQAHAIWTAIGAMPLVNSQTEVRVWVDQNLHRKKFPEGTEWHEFGLLPYACLSTVIVGVGDFSLKHAYTRPWLWVEMITALKGDGIHTAPDYDVSEDCGGVLSTLERYEQFKPAILRFGWIMGPRRHVDRVMDEITRYISLWRRRGFMGHTNYQYADDFEKFVNWARRFVIRGVPYSQMSWNHSSDKPVKGMDSVALIRAFPREGGLTAESLVAVMRPNISWACHSMENDSCEWVVGDLIDRSNVDDLPLHTIVELTKEDGNGFQEILICGEYSSMESATFKKENGMVSMTYDRRGGSAREVSRYGMVFQRMMDDSISCAEMVTLSGSQEDGDILTYFPFTRRVSLAKSQQGLPVGSASLRPAKLSAAIQNALQLERVGFFHNCGICEQVYDMKIGAKSLRLSTSECVVLLEASQGEETKFAEMATALKENYEYKTMRHRDLSESERRYLARGWTVEVQNFSDQNTMSGEAQMDVENQIVEMLRTMEDGCTLVRIQELNEDRVRMSFRSNRKIMGISARPIQAKREVAILQVTDLDILANSNLTGLLQMAIGMQPAVEVKAFGAGLNPRMEASEAGQEICLNMVSGLFVKCSVCEQLLCQLNGLQAEVSKRNDMYQVTWHGRHTCVGHEYAASNLEAGIRIV